MRRLPTISIQKDESIKVSILNSASMLGQPHGVYHVCTATFGEIHELHTSGPDAIKGQILELYSLLNAPLLAHLRSLGLAESDADDVVQETFLRLMRHLSDGKSERNLRAWLFQVAYNQAMNYYRFDRRFVSLSEEFEDRIPRYQEYTNLPPNPEEVCIYNENIQQLNSALAYLPKQQRKCMVMRSKGMRYREIATSLGVTTQRVAMLMDRGMARLAARL